MSKNFNKGALPFETLRKLLLGSSTNDTPECIASKSHAGGTPVAPHLYADVLRRRRHDVQISKEPCADIYILLCQYIKEYNLRHIHAATPTGKLTQRRRS